MEGPCRGKPERGDEPCPWGREGDLPSAPSPLCLCYQQLPEGLSAGDKGIGDLSGVHPSADVLCDGSDSSWGRKELCKGSLGYSRCRQWMALSYGNGQ